MSVCLEIKGKKSQREKFKIKRKIFGSLNIYIYIDQRVQTYYVCLCRKRKKEREREN